MNTGSREGKVNKTPDVSPALAAVLAKTPVKLPLRVADVFERETFREPRRLFRRAGEGELPGFT